MGMGHLLMILNHGSSDNQIHDNDYLKFPQDLEISSDSHDDVLHHSDGGSESILQDSIQDHSHQGDEQHENIEHSFCRINRSSKNGLSSIRPR